MCGIAGIALKNDLFPDEQVLLELRNALGHRGPDGFGFHKDKGIGLVQTRLAIIDIEGGRQPIYENNEEKNGAVIVVNGEIYNYLELKKDFLETNFYTNSDCELPIAVYRRHGLDFVKFLRGMYALALWDGEKLILARDSFGIKPLYYAETSKGLIFASEPKAIIATGLVGVDENTAKVFELFQLQFTTGKETVFKGIKRLLPGEIIVVKNGEIVNSVIKTFLPEVLPEGIGEQEALKKLDDVLLDSVAVHERSDVPFGMFLSGGIDSSALLSLMAKLSSKPVMAFTAGFPETLVHDEREHAKKLARITKAHHSEIEIRAEDFYQVLPKIAEAMDDPVADYATIPTYLLAEAAKKDVTVILSGEGGDELFAGYGRYRSYMLPFPFNKKMRRKGTFDNIKTLFRKEFSQDIAGWRKELSAAEARIENLNIDKLQKAQRIDSEEWLANDLLIKLDRCLMRHGAEGRVPFLDKIVADFAFSLPKNLKIKGRSGKWLLRKWLDNNLPEAQAFSKKRGFTVPVFEWIYTRRAEIGKMVAAQSGINRVCEPALVASLFANLDRNNSFAAWTLLFYALWHQQHILGQKVQGNLFESLSNNT